jgi:hypothetical protein
MLGFRYSNERKHRIQQWILGQSGLSSQVPRSPKYQHANAAALILVSPLEIHIETQMSSLKIPQVKRMQEKPLFPGSK